jgi:hypothetical protein
VWLRQLVPVKYSREVSAIILTSAASRSDTCNIFIYTSTQFTYLFHAEESESDREISDPVANYKSTETVGKRVEGAISSLTSGISELETIGFDETLLLEESDDIA